MISSLKTIAKSALFTLVAVLIPALVIMYHCRGIKKIDLWAAILLYGLCCGVVYYFIFPEKERRGGDENRLD